jgi:hypothetical protein
MLVPTSCAHHKWQAKLAIELSISCIMQESHFFVSSEKNSAELNRVFTKKKKDA